MESLYCRLCAEPRFGHELMHLDLDDTKWNEVQLKLDSLIVVTSHNNLPKSVCFVCYESLNKAYDFFDKVKKAQEILSSLFPVRDDSKFVLSDDEDRAALDEFFNEPLSIPTIKEENTSPVKPGVEPNGIFVKVEPKEDETDSSQVLQDAIDTIPPSHDNDSLSVQDILAEALTKASIPTIDEIKENSVKQCKLKINKKVKSWNEVSWICGLCDMSFMDISYLWAHSKVAHNKCAVFSCIGCKKRERIASFKTFVKHARKHHVALRNRCPYCNERFPKTEMKDHVKLHFLDNNVQCKMCGEILESEESMQHHLEENITKTQRKPRRKRGTPITTEDLTCDICKNVYKTRNSLRDHIKRHRDDRNRNHTCDRCGKTFLNKGTLKYHIMAHDEVRPYVCRICDKAFLFPNMLRRHVNTHSSEKPYSCEICGRCFRLKHQLNSHKIIHTDSMPYSCRFCTKSFRFKQILLGHERQHTGAKPYSCQLCFMEFSNWSNYNKHMKRRHNLDMAKKKITQNGVFPVNPETGQIVENTEQGLEQWKSEVMIPKKRGKKKAIKEESENT